MVLTYNMIINRLDELNSRETQVRKFYKPLLDRPSGKPYPRRHRFADMLEPGDVVKTVTQNGDDMEEELLDDAENQPGAEPLEPAAILDRRGSAKPSTTAPIERLSSAERFPAAATNHQEPSVMAFATDRKGQRIVGLASEHERALHTDVETEVRKPTNRDPPLRHLPARPLPPQHATRSIPAMGCYSDATRNCNQTEERGGGQPTTRREPDRV